MQSLTLQSQGSNSIADYLLLTFQAIQLLLHDILICSFGELTQLHVFNNVYAE